MQGKSDFMFEVSWEVCNKVGGIFTVVASKILPMQRFYKARYFAVGPYFPGKTKADVFKEEIPLDFLKDVFEKLLSLGIKCHYGKWITDGDPNTILIDYTNYTHKVNDIKKEFWDRFKIDSWGSKYHDYDEPMLWSYTVGMLLEQLKNKLAGKKIVAQFHEWMSGGGLLYLKSRQIKIGTVFTTHATMLGRTLATNNIDLYGLLDKLNPYEKAYEFGVQTKFLTEKACAHSADVFTTVSEITGLEATHLLGKKPDVLLPNGVDVERFPTFDDASIKHKLFKGKMKKFLMYYFFPYYTFDLDNTLIFFLAGRYEFHDKGIDVFINSLAKLNEEMKKNGTEKTIVAFIWVPTSVKNIKEGIMENRSYFEDIEDSVHDIIEEVNDRIVYGLVGRKDINSEFLLGPTLIKETKKRIARFSKDGNPPVCTHDIYNEDDDPIMKSIKLNNLLNTKEDKVKIIFYPIYLTGADNLLDLTYYEAIMASHLGVFPSYYEPWGYTPMEAGALGIASVTTDLAGFGRYIQKHGITDKNPGIYVLKRHNMPVDKVVDQLTNVFLKFKSLSKQDRIENKLRAKRLADMADWNILIENYIEAHNLAVERNG